jgi:hypothetical protein
MKIGDRKPETGDRRRGEGEMERLRERRRGDGEMERG